MSIPLPATTGCYAPDTRQRMSRALATLESVRAGGIGELSRFFWMIDTQQSVSLQAGFAGIARLCREMQDCLKAVLRGQRSLLGGVAELERHCATIRSHAEAVAEARIRPSLAPNTTS